MQSVECESASDPRSDAWIGVDGASLRVLAGVAMALAIGAVALIIALRIGYPMQLEWMEGGSLQEALRVLAGKDIYVPPDADYVPYAYSPLYFYLCAPLVRLLGATLLPLRLVAAAASVGIAIVLYRVVAAQRRRPFGGLVAVALFVGSFRATGAWLDIARPDTLYLFFGVLSYSLLTINSPTRAKWCLRNIGAALAILLSFYSKQTGLALGALLLVATIPRWRENLCVAGIVTLGFTLSKLYFDWRTHGWFSFYMFQVPNGRFRVGYVGHENLPRFWSDTAIPMFPVLLSLAVMLVAHHTMRRHWARAWEFAVLSAGVLALVWLTRMEMGSYDNNLLPAAVVLALVGGVAVSEMLGRSTEVWGCLAVLTQLYVFRYDWPAQVPWSADWNACAVLRRKIEQLPGTKAFTHGDYVGPMPDVVPLAQPQAVNDVTRADAVQGQLLAHKVAAFYRERKVDWVIADSLRGYPWSDINDAQVQNYEQRMTTLDDPDRLWPRTGMMTRPTMILQALSGDTTAK